MMSSTEANIIADSWKEGRAVSWMAGELGYQLLTWEGKRRLAVCETGMRPTCFEPIHVTLVRNCLVIRCRGDQALLFDVEGEE